MSEIEKRLIPQLVLVKNRLETYPFAIGELKLIKDALLIVLRTVAGEQVDINVAKLGDTTLAGSYSQPAPAGGQSVTVGGQVLNHGVEIGPGCVQYPPQNQQPSLNVQMSPPPMAPAVIDVAAGVAAFAQGIPAAVPVTSEMPKPVAGSLMAEAMANSTGTKVHIETDPDVAAAPTVPTAPIVAPAVPDAVPAANGE